MLKDYLAVAAAMSGMGTPHREPSWTREYQRPGGHQNAKAAAKADKRRRMQKATKKAQRKGR